MLIPIEQEMLILAASHNKHRYICGDKEDAESQLFSSKQTVRKDASHFPKARAVELENVGDQVTEKGFRST